MAEHTPGPWEVNTYYSGSKLTGQWTRIEPGVIRESSFTRRDSYGDACFHGVNISDDDANLIAAAPDLLAAAKAVLAYAAEIEHYPSTGNVYDELGAAVARAEGKEDAEQRN